MWTQLKGQFALRSCKHSKCNQSSWWKRPYLLVFEQTESFYRWRQQQKQNHACEVHTTLSKTRQKLRVKWLGDKHTQRHTNAILLRRCSRMEPEGCSSSTFPPICFTHSLQPPRNVRERRSEKLTCPVQVGTPSFLTRRLRKLKRTASARKGKKTHGSADTLCSRAVLAETHMFTFGNWN